MIKVFKYSFKGFVFDGTATVIAANETEARKIIIKLLSAESALKNNEQLKLQHQIPQLMEIIELKDNIGVIDFDSGGG